MAPGVRWVRIGRPGRFRGGPASRSIGPSSAQHRNGARRVSRPDWAPERLAFNMHTQMPFFNGMPGKSEIRLRTFPLKGRSTSPLGAMPGVDRAKGLSGGG